MQYYRVLGYTNSHVELKLNEEINTLIHPVYTITGDCVVVPNV